jgi:hypothetical protein
MDLINLKVENIDYESEIYDQNDNNIDYDKILYMVCMNKYEYDFKYIMYLQFPRYLIITIKLKYLVYALCNYSYKKEYHVVYGSRGPNNLQYNTSSFKNDNKFYLCVNSYNGEVYHMCYINYKHCIHIQFDLYGSITHLLQDNASNKMFKKILKNIMIIDYNYPRGLYDLLKK